MENLIWVPFIASLYVFYKSWDALLKSPTNWASCPYFFLALGLAAPVPWFFIIMGGALAFHGFNMANTSLGLGLCEKLIGCMLASSLVCNLNAHYAHRHCPQQD
ncbi:MAG: hypothetical protein WC465_02455 [Patescibacteria group bacterium]